MSVAASRKPVRAVGRDFFPDRSNHAEQEIEHQRTASEAHTGFREPMHSWGRHRSVESRCGTRNIREMDPTLERMADALVESGDYRVIRRLQPRTEYHPADDNPKLIAAVVDVETTGTDPEHDKIIELGMCVFEYGRNDGRIYRVIGSWNWLEDPGIPLPPEITRASPGSPIRWLPGIASTMLL